MKKKKIIIITAISVVVLAAIILAIIFVLNSNQKFTVRFNSLGGSEIAELKVKKDTKISLPENPTKEGFTFLYWMDEEEIPVLDGFVVTKDVVLTAKWSDPNQEVCTITFNTDGGPDLPSLTVVKGEVVKLPDNITKDGYKFSHWVDEMDVTFNSETPIEKDLTLKAIWEKVEEEKKEEKKQEEKVETPAPQTQQTVEAAGISLDKSSVDLIIGKSGKLNATITPDNAANKSVTWASSNSSIISVDSDGTVTGKGIGSATITAKTANGKTASATVYSDVESITLSSSSNYISSYGGTSKSNLTVTTSPSVDPSLIVWSAPDASGPNAAAYFSGSGKAASITARSAWTNSSIPVTVSVGRVKSNKVTIYVEPELTLSCNTWTAITNGYSVPNGSTNTVNSSVDVTWSYSTSHITNVSSPARYFRFTSNVQSSHPEGFTLKATSKAGQVKQVSITLLKQ